MQKLIAMLLVIASLCTVLAACDTDSAPKDNTTAVTTTTKKDLATDNPSDGTTTGEPPVTTAPTGGTTTDEPNTAIVISISAAGRRAR